MTFSLESKSPCLRQSPPLAPREGASLSEAQKVTTARSTPLPPAAPRNRSSSVQSPVIVGVPRAGGPATTLERVQEYILSLQEGQCFGADAFSPKEETGENYFSRPSTPTGEPSTRKVRQHRDPTSAGDFGVFPDPREFS